MIQLYNNGSCMVCREIITNPICLECIAREIKAWLLDESENVLINGVNNMMGLDKRIEMSIETERENEKGVQCIICKEHHVNLCPHCFSKKVYEMLKENASKKLLKQFLVFFNYDLKNDN